MKMRLRWAKGLYLKLSAIALLTCYVCIAVSSAIPPILAKSPDWVIQSNKFADVLEKAINAKDCQKKLAVSESLEEVDPTFRACRQQKLIQSVRSLEQKLSQEKNAELHLDLEILIKAGQRELRSYALDEKYQVPYINLSKAILESLKSTSKSSSNSKAAILAKLKQHAGLEPGRIALAASLEQGFNHSSKNLNWIFPVKIS